MAVTPCWLEEIPGRVRVTASRRWSFDPNASSLPIVGLPWLNEAVGPQPGIKAAPQHKRSRVTRFSELAHHTGAGRLIPSAAVHDDVIAFGTGRPGQAPGRHEAHGPGYLETGGGPIRGPAGVQEQDRLASMQPHPAVVHTDGQLPLAQRPWSPRHTLPLVWVSVRLGPIRRSAGRLFRADRRLLLVVHDTPRGVVRARGTPPVSPALPSFLIKLWEEPEQGVH
jgi:hypothetical protein